MYKIGTRGCSTCIYNNNRVSLVFHKSYISLFFSSEFYVRELFYRLVLLWVGEAGRNYRIIIE